MNLATLKQRAVAVARRAKTYLAIAVGGGCGALASFLSEPANFTEGTPRLKRLGVAFGTGAAIAIFHLVQTPPAPAPVPPSPPAP